MKLRDLKFALFLFLLTYCFRTYFALSHVPFSQDQARDLMITENNIEAGNFLVAYGPKTSIGDFTVFPFYYQLMLLAHLIVDHPLTMYLIVTFLESVTPVVLFFLLRLFVSKKIALTGALIYSFSHLVVTYSTNAWSPNLIPLFSTLSLFCWMKFLVEDKAKYISLGVLAAALALHLHFQAVILIPFVFLVLFVSLKRSLANIKYWIVGVALALATFVPYISQEIADGWPNTLSIIHFYTQEHSQYFDRVSKPAYLLSFFPAFFERLLFGINVPLLLVGRMIFFGGLGLIIYRSISSKKYRWLLAYYLSLLFFLRMFKGDKLDYYLMLFFSMPAVLLAIMLEQLKKVSGARYLLILPLAYFLGMSLFTPTFNELETVFSNTAEVVVELDLSQPVHIIFHDLDQANNYLYALTKTSNIKFNKSSSTILDFCISRAQCKEAMSNRCRYGEPTTYSALIKWDNHDGQSQEATRELVSKDGFAAYLTKLDLDTDEKVFPNVNSGIEDRKDLIIDEIN